MAVIHGLVVSFGLLLADSQPVTSYNPTATLWVTCRHEKICICNTRCCKSIFVIYSPLTSVNTNYRVSKFNWKCLCWFRITISPLYQAPIAIHWASLFWSLLSATSSVNPDKVLLSRALESINTLPWWFVTKRLNLTNVIGNVTQPCIFTPHCLPTNYKNVKTQSWRCSR